MHTTLTAAELETVTGGIAGKKQPTSTVEGAKTVSKPLSPGQPGPTPVSGNLPGLSPLQPPQPIVAQQIVGRSA
ncbi:MAG TPA: hypothetical protein VGL61_27765 [Kofleriaceae bacterium]|jgi:hypothetical protein